MSHALLGELVEQVRVLEERLSKLRDENVRLHQALQGVDRRAA